MIALLYEPRQDYFQDSKPQVERLEPAGVADPPHLSDDPDYEHSTHDETQNPGVPPGNQGEDSSDKVPEADHDQKHQARD